ncbi:unnamed protein product [Arabidopsis lyrata]|nr:unnamed protein product [Arabidopsis lyrata]
MEKPKFKTVQELLAAGEKLPERYLCTPTGDGEGDQPFNVSMPEMEIMVIDLSLLLSSSDDGREELSKLHSAISTWGVVQVMNHGISEAFLDKILELTRQFFVLPTEEKHKYAREISSFQGFGNDMILSDDQVLDWVDRLYLITYPEDQRQLKFWPKIPSGFRETLLEYTMKQQLVVEKFFKALARSLGLEDNCFLEMHGENATLETRFNMYPPCPRPDKFLKDGKWYKASILPHTILINVGDTMEVMSNGIYKSPVHRVVLNNEKARISVVTFCDADEDKEIQPVTELVSEARPRLYKAVKKSEKNFFNYYQQGRRPIEAAFL